MAPVSGKFRFQGGVDGCRSSNSQEYRFSRYRELLLLSGFLILLHVMTPVSCELGAFPPEYVQPGGNITFVENGDGDLYGNNVTYRVSDLPESSQKCFVDSETALPTGVLVRFYLYVHNVSNLDDQSRNLRLQIWRPDDPSVQRYLLVWEQKVMIDVFKAGALYSFKLNTTFTVSAEDRIGWTNEGPYGPISFEYMWQHKTYFAKINMTNNTSSVPSFPVVGTTVTFDVTYFPGIFSVVVEIDPTALPGSPDTTDASGLTGAIATTGVTVTTAVLSTPINSTATTTVISSVTSSSVLQHTSSSVLQNVFFLILFFRIFSN